MVDGDAGSFGANRVAIVALYGLFGGVAALAMMWLLANRGQ
jgi:hypothetical protein